MAVRQRCNNPEREAATKLEAEGWQVYGRGWPDFLCVKGDKLRFIEVKPGSHKPSKHQRVLFGLLKTHLGVTVEVMRTKARGRRIRLLGVGTVAGLRLSAEKAKAYKESGLAHVLIGTTRMQVVAPYNEAFRLGARQLSGRYAANPGYWKFKLGVREEVITLVTKVYGSCELHMNRIEE